MASGASVSVTGCVPLAGGGMIARYGALLGVTAARGPRPDPLLRTLAAVAASGGDGGDLVRGAAGAAFGARGEARAEARDGATWACAGVTADGGVAVLVHGRAVAAVRVDADPEVTLRAVDPATPVSRKFAGATVTLCLLVGEAAAPEPQFWLGDGVACGSGLMVTVTADASQLAGSHPPTADATIEATVFDAAHGMGDQPRPVLVDGALCASGHFTDPARRTCRQCGIGIYQPPRNIQRGPRPPLGVLVLDDGTRFRLDCDYVIGREPTFDSDVLDGRSRPLRISDPNGTVSRLHLRISLVGWRVEVSDLGSANGSVLQSSEGERRLVPYESTAIEPGARIGIGHRIMQYLA